MHKLIIIFTLLLSMKSYASLDYQNTMLLATLVSTSADQLARLTKLVKKSNMVAEELTRVSNAIEDKIDMAEMIEYHVEELMALKEMDIYDLESLVDELTRLKGVIVDSAEYLHFLKEKLILEKFAEKKVKKDRIRNRKKKGLAMRRMGIKGTSSHKDIMIKDAKTNCMIYSEMINNSNHLIDVNEQLVALNQKDTKQKSFVLAEQKSWEDYYGINKYSKRLNKKLVN